MTDPDPNPEAVHEAVHDLDRAVRRATPATVSSFADVLDRRVRRRARRRTAVGLGVATAAVVTVAAGVVATRDDAAAPPVSATDATSPTPEVDPITTPTPPPRPAYPEVDPGSDQVPPDLVLGTDGGPVRTQPGSSCWGNGCSDAVRPQAATLPDVGSAAVLRASFPFTGQWSVGVRDDGGQACAGYPVLVEPTSATGLDLTPTGPPGPRVADFFVYPEPGGDVTGFWRWTVPERDRQPLAWVSITQNTPSSGGAELLELVVDDAAVDGDVSAAVTIETTDGGSTQVTLPQVVQHCPGDGFVEARTTYVLEEGTLDDLGPLPYRYRVDLTVDGATYVGTGTFTGAHEVAGGDTRITFDPPLPTLDQPTATPGAG